jgi:hypothetical protein
MPDSAGTLERIAIELANALSKIPGRLGSDRLSQTLTDLGIGFPGAIPSGVTDAGNAAAAAAGSISDTLQGLITAIENDDTVTIVADGVELIARCGQVIEGFAALANGLSTAGVAIPADFAQRVFDFFIIDHIDALPTAGNILTLLGVIERIDHPGTPGDPTQPAYTEQHLHWQRLLDFLSNPATHLQNLYDWGAPGFTGDKLLPALNDFIARQGLPTILHPASGGQPMRLEAFAFDLTPNTAVTPHRLDIAVMFPVGGSINTNIPLPVAGWTAQLTFAGEVIVGTSGTLTPPAELDFQPPSGTLEGQALLQLTGAPASPFVLFGQAGKSRVEVAGVQAGLGISFAWNSGHAQAEPLVTGKISGGKVIIDNSEGDGFLSTLLSGVKAEADFDLGFEWSTSSGIHFEGTGALVIELPVHISLGPIDFTGIYLSAGLQGSSIPIEVSAAIDASLGPLQASVDRLGVQATLSFPAGGGNIGPAQIDLSFKPPSGVGLAINADIVVGGGYLYFDPDKGEYAGVAELSIADVVTVKAIGLITTKMPDGSSGFSLLLILTTDFPPIQLGFGFTLNGIGGLLGLNRSVQLDVLRDGVRTGAVDDIMFPTDIIANAPRIISDLKAIFPPHENVFLVGPMAEFGWGDPSLVTLSLGVIVEIPPGNIAILGVLKVALPTEDEALILIQVAFLGILDFDEQLLSFDASLYDSHVLFMTLEGDMAVRLKWGDNAAFILSVGGFHPAFHPPDGLHLPASMKRLSISILDYDWAKIKVDCYFAVTSNTVQFGAHLYLFFGVDDANLSGTLGLDVLFQFSPFMFIAQISGSLSISVFGMDLLSIGLSFALSGPTPWEAKGTGSLSILFFSISISFDVTWGEKKDTSLPPVDVMPIFLGEINKQLNWKALPPPSANLLVTLRSVDPSLLVLHPFGSLTLSQRALPLNLKLDKVGNQQPDDVNKVDITAVAATGTGNLPLNDDDEQFAIAQFQNMSDSDKLSRPSYQSLKGGVIIGSSDSVQSSKMTRRTISYDITIIDKEPQQPLPKGRHYAAVSGLFHPFLSGSAAARSPLSYQGKTQLKPFTDKIAVGQEGYAVSNTSDNKPLSAASTFSSEAMARDYMNSQVASSASLASGMHVLPNSEVNAP